MRIEGFEFQRSRRIRYNSVWIDIESFVQRLHVCVDSTCCCKICLHVTSDRNRNEVLRDNACTAVGL